MKIILSIKYSNITPPEDKIFNSTKQITILGYVPLYYKEMMKLKRKLDNLSTEATAVTVR